MGSGFGTLAITTGSAKNTVRKFWFFIDLADRRPGRRSLQSGHGLMRTIKTIELLVPVSFTPYGASTSGLSTWWSSTALEGMLVLKEASCLDAFSSYPVRI